MSRLDFDATVDNVRVRAEIELAGANALRSITRTRLILEAGEFPQGNPPAGQDVDRYMLRRTVYPDLIASTNGGWIEIGERRYDLPDLPFSAFEEIPFGLLVAWERGAYAANPDWLPEAQPAKKKPRSNGLGASSASTAAARTTTRSRKRST